MKREYKTSILALFVLVALPACEALQNVQGSGSRTDDGGDQSAQTKRPSSGTPTTEPGNSNSENSNTVSSADSVFGNIIIPTVTEEEIDVYTTSNNKNLRKTAALLIAMRKVITPFNPSFSSNIIASGATSYISRGKICMDPNNRLLNGSITSICGNVLVYTVLSASYEYPVNPQNRAVSTSDRHNRWKANNSLHEAIKIYEELFFDGREYGQIICPFSAGPTLSYRPVMPVLTSDISDQTLGILSNSGRKVGELNAKDFHIMAVLTQMIQIQWELLYAESQI